MTKEPIEVLSEVSGLLPSTIESNYKWVLEAMKLFANQESIAFLIWVDANGYQCDLHTDDNEKIWQAYNSKPYTTEQLYELYLSQKEK